MAKILHCMGNVAFSVEAVPHILVANVWGCRSAHNRGDCFTFDCVDDKKIAYCGQCTEFPCDEIMTREKATVLDKKWLEWKRTQRTK